MSGARPVAEFGGAHRGRTWIVQTPWGELHDRALRGRSGPPQTANGCPARPPETNGGKAKAGEWGWSLVW